MQFSVNRSELAPLLSNVSRFAAAKHSVAILECAYFEFCDDKLTVTGYDLDKGVKGTIPATARVDESFSFAVNAKKISDVVSKFKDGNVTFDISDSAVTIKNGRSKTKMNIISGDYPSTADIAAVVEFETTADDFHRLCDQTLYAAAVTDKKPILCGVQISVTDNNVAFTATDRYRIAAAYEIIKNPNGSGSFVIHAATLKNICSVFKGGTVKVSSGKRATMFNNGKYSVFCRNLEGEFFNSQHVLSQSYPTYFTVDAAAVTDILDRYGLVDSANNKVRHSLKCNIAVGEMKLEYADETTAMEDTVEISGEIRNSIVISFNRRYLLEAFKAAGSGKLNVSFSNPISPIHITADGESEKFKFVVLPVRLK